MSHQLWRCYWENDVDRFRRLLAPASQASQAGSRTPVIGHDSGFSSRSPGGFGTSPRSVPKTRKTSGHTPTPGRTKDAITTIGRHEVNSRDNAGLTILLRAALSTDPAARDFVEALIEHPAIDLYAQDPESGWNALHRSLYAGNVSIARILLKKEREYLTSHDLSSVSRVGMLIKTKDHEGNSPFDLYNSTIATRDLHLMQEKCASESDSESGDSVDYGADASGHSAQPQVWGDEVYVFGSNKNLSLGVGDEDDRQFPERIQLRRPDELVRKLYEDHLSKSGLEPPQSPPLVEDIPTQIRNCPLVIDNVVMSKLHSAILTTDPVSNLYICGVGRGGRLGLGDENTQFRFVPVQGPLSDKKIQKVALGLNHTLAVTDDGELWTWGLNTDSQLGYILPPPTKADEEPMCVTPRQVFGSLKKEVVLGVATSGIHSVAHTGSALYCWGRNVGQLALMDSDSRSLDVQYTPRKVGASLLSAPIQMVSAIDKATTCLLANSSVWVFTNYGYNLVKFPAVDMFANYNLTVSHSSHYEPGRKEIQYITSGGDTIAALTASGDLFTMQVNQKLELTQPAASTTNPVKIKGALSQPQCIWDSRKDGAASVNVGEHGSVIICTTSGAVWKRVKRSKGKAAVFVDQSGKRKDFKFERVPYITNCIMARSSTFGAFAAVRKDSKVMSDQIKVQEPSLWDDLSDLLSISDFKALNHDSIKLQKSWDTAIMRERVDSVAYEMLRSSNIENDMRQWLQDHALQHENMDMEICTSILPDIKIPVHGWVLAARSPVLRSAFAQFRNGELTSHTESFVLGQGSQRTILTLLNADLYTILNLVLYAYLDTILPVWKYTRDSPANAFRFRQVRTELMKIATLLDMAKLESASRLQIGLERSLDTDLQEAISDDSFFEDGDVILELDEGEEVIAHSQLLCQRCPFFEGMFFGRSGGQWLAKRRDSMAPDARIQIDLRHMDANSFRYVMAFMYGDTGPEIFDDVAAATVDEFSELVFDVMNIANELMLDRLSQICQSLIGKFVSARNVAGLLNEISPCSVTGFKDTGLEYICLQLENMLENHFLDDLDEDLLVELDGVVRDNQLARFPIVRSGRAELLLHEKYPDLIADITEEHETRIKEFAYKASQRDEKLSSSYKQHRFGSLDELAGQSPTTERSRRKSKNGRNEPFSPTLRPKVSMGEMIFDMDEDNCLTVSNPASPDLQGVDSGMELDVEPISQLPKSWQKPRGSVSFEPATKPLNNALVPDARPRGPEQDGSNTPPVLGPTGKIAGSPWGATSFSKSGFGLKDIMSETKSTSALSAGLASQGSKDANKPQAKLSQKERKKQMQMQAVAQAAEQESKANHVPWETVPPAGRQAPWKSAAPPPKASLKDAMQSDTVARGAAAAVNNKPLLASEAVSKQSKVRTASPDTRFPGQGRTNSSPSTPGTPASKPSQKPVVPHSKSYITPASKSDFILGTSMADIIGQQRREQELVKEAVAKRSLQEIQQEQAFQEWWDQESRRAQEEEARRQTRGEKQDPKPGQRGRRGRGGGKGRSNESSKLQTEGSSHNRDGGAPRKGKGVRGK
ncbi:unnamed protein product [Clonostachys byssicola]|uniref:BTB domain-containing protein n=1 Tax=Clonostachys byssicola TaxID=160290 RepID=A0A9N9UWL6_9HYPO|nr:unnamed protein product [Clonostachys byssicola]